MFVVICRPRNCFMSSSYSFLVLFLFMVKPRPATTYSPDSAVRAWIDGLVPGMELCLLIESL